MKLFRIENISLKPLLVLAHNPEDAVNIFAHSLVMGMGNRPDADFDVVDWDPAHVERPNPLIEWVEKCHRGIAWLVDDGAGWELVSTRLVEP